MTDSAVTGFDESMFFALFDAAEKAFDEWFVLMDHEAFGTRLCSVAERIRMMLLAVVVQVRAAPPDLQDRGLQSFTDAHANALDMLEFARGKLADAPTWH
ncbi:MAG: hypothetical protein U1F48_05275 [Burkholderiales bacterium]